MSNLYTKDVNVKDENLDWLADIPEATEQKQVNLDNMYTTVNEEMGLQQKKRDQIITLYLAMITFFVPFTIELTGASMVKGFLFLFLSVIGVILGLIVVRYRIYKEIYWISLRTVGQLKTYNMDVINKSLIQSLYFKSLTKIAKKYVDNDKQKIKIIQLAKASLFSAETLYFVLIGFVSSTILSVGLVFILSGLQIFPRIAIAGCVGLVVLVLQYFKYIRELAKIYLVAAKPTNKKLFNSVFSKAWHLHFYTNK